MSDSVATSDSVQSSVPMQAGGDAILRDDQFDADEALMRLVIGGMLLGTDELRDRLRRWDASARATQASAVASPPDPSTSLRRAFVGAAFETEGRMRRGLSAILARTVRLADDANLVYTRLAFSVRGTPLDAVRRRLDEALFLTLTAVDRWTARGSSEERQGRHMAEQAAVSVIDELLDYMARNPEVRQLIEQQGMGMAESAVGEVRERTASADQWIERLAHNLIRRPIGETPVKPPDGTAAPPPAAAVRAPHSPAASKPRPRASGAQAQPQAQPRPPAAAAAGAAEAQMTHSNDPG